VDQRVEKPKEDVQIYSGDQSENRVLKAMKMNILQRYMDQV